MGNLFSSKPLKEVIRENKRLINHAVRDLEKEIGNLERNEKKLISDIKKMAGQNQMGAVRIMAKDLVRTRHYVTKFIEMKTHLNAVALQVQTIQSHEALASAMKSVTKVMVRMNNQLKLPELQKIMTEFAVQNERAEMTQEVMGDAVDDALTAPGSEEEENRVVAQVLDEIGINIGGDMQDAPLTTAQKSAQSEEKSEAKQPMTADTGMSDLEARLNNLRK